MNLGTIWAELAINLTKFDQGLREAEAKIKNAENSLDGITKAGERASAVGKKMTMGLTLPILGAAAAAVKMSADFEQAMANAASVSGATAEELQYMTDVAREMGAKTAFSAKEAGDAMYYMASAGWNAQQMGKAIEPTLALAAATQHDLAATTDMVVATLNQFDLASDDASRVTNVFAAAIGASQANMDKLAYSMRYVGPVANSLGYDVEATTAALMGLYNAGFQGEQAGTVLRSALSRLLKPTKEMTEAADSLGINMEQLNPATNELVDIIRVLEDAEIDAARAVALFGQEAGPGMLALIGKGADAINEYEKAITGTEAASEMADKQLETLGGQLKILSSALTEVALMVGDILIPILTDFVQNTLLPFVQRIQEMDERWLKFLMALAGIVAVIGPVLLAFGAAAKAIVNIKAAAVILAPVFKAIGVAIGAVTAPAWAIVAAIAAVIAIGVLLWKNWDKIGPALAKAWDATKAAIGKAVEGIVTFFSGLPERIGTFLANVITAAATWAADLQQRAIEAGKQFLASVMQFFSELPYKIGFALGRALRIIIDFAMEFPATVAAAVTAAIDFFKALPGNIATFLTEAVTNAIAWAGEMRAKAIQAGQDFVSNVVSFMVELPGKVRDTFTSAVQRAITFAVEMRAKAIQAGQNAVNGVMDTIKSLPGKVWDVLVETAGNLLRIGGKLWDNAKTAASNLWEGFKKGLGIASPSYLERAMMAIADQSATMKTDLEKNIKGLDKLTSKVDIDVEPTSPWWPKPGGGPMPVPVAAAAGGQGGPVLHLHSFAGPLVVKGVTAAGQAVDIVEIVIERVIEEIRG